MPRIFCDNASMNGRPPEIPPHKLISALRGYNLLPAIVFLPTRRKCDEAASEVAADKTQRTDNEKFQLRKDLFESYAADFPEVRSHKHARILVNSGIASHHAGHIPSWKLLIEKMMSGGLLNAIFATSTVAAGVDFPARTVVISNADTRGNDGWRPITASELQQMTGRAGRRGKDNVGFAVLAPGQFQNPKKIAELLKAPPDPLESKFRATYTTLLNLLDAFGSFEQLREITEKSFAFQATVKQVERLKRDRTDLELKLASNGLGISIEDIRGFERLTSAKRRLDERIPFARADLRQRWLEQNVTAGRVITQGRSGKRLFIVISVNGENVSTMRDDGAGRNVPISRIIRVFEKTYRLNENDIEKAFFDTFEGKNAPLAEPKLSQTKPSGDADEIIERLIGSFSENGSDAERFLWESAGEAGDLEKIERDISTLRTNIWAPFDSRAKVLDKLGYLNFATEKVTSSGKWLADLRVDRPLLVGEAMRQGIFDDLETKTLAGIMASLAADSDRNYGELYLSDALLDVISGFEDVIHEVSRVEWHFGIDPSEEINLSAAAAAERWAAGMSWDDLVKRTQAEEGDLVRLLSRTGEALMQIAHLKDSNPAMAGDARLAAATLLREPIR